MDPRAVLQRALGRLDPGRRWRHLIVGVSGGADSLALLDLLTRELRPLGVRIDAAHVDHGQHPDAGRVATRVAALADRMGCGWHATRLSLGPAAGETAAREARLDWLAGLRAAVGADAVALAHHADDQAETVLLRVLHGSGPAGLAAMAERRGVFIRPLLEASHADLVAHCSARGLEWWEDPANADPRHLRSWVRRELLPAVEVRLPGAATSLRVAAGHAAATRRAWDAVLEALPGLDPRPEPDGISVVAAPLAAYDSGLAGELLQGLARRVECPLGRGRTGRLLSWVNSTAAGRTLELGQGWLAARSGTRLYLARVAPPPSAATLAPAGGSLRWGSWRVAWRPGVPDGIERRGWSAWVQSGALRLRPALAGDRIAPVGGAGHRPVRKCLQEEGVPAFRRAGWPVLERDDEVVWVPGICRGSGALPLGGREGVRVDVSRVS